MSELNELDEFCIEHFGSRLDRLPTEFGCELESMYKKGALSVESKMKASFVAGFNAGIGGCTNPAIGYEHAKLNNLF